MSEREFERYLSLLGGLLKLTPRQRADIAEELRAHLEERLETLTAGGMPREAAVQAALDEFGDAAGLANHFTSVAHLKTRRRIMRWTTGTIATMTCAILTLAHFWPAERPHGPLAVSPVSAQDGSGGAEAGGGVAATASSAMLHDNEIEGKLSQLTEFPIEFFDMPLRDAVQFLSDELEVPVLYDPELLEDSGFDSNTPINLAVDAGRLSARSVFNLIFAAGSTPHEYSYVVRDRVILITYISNTMTTRVYDCRDLLAAATPGPPPAELAGGAAGMMGGDMGMGMEMMAGAGEDAYGAMYGAQGGFGAPGMGFGGGMGPGGGSPAGPPVWSNTPAGRLIRVVAQTVDPDGWRQTGGDGTLEEFGGMLVVKNVPAVHVEVEALLKQLRDALQVNK